MNRGNFVKKHIYLLENDIYSVWMEEIYLETPEKIFKIFQWVKNQKISNDTIAKERKLMENSRITIIRTLDLTTTLN